MKKLILLTAMAVSVFTSNITAQGKSQAPRAGEAAMKTGRMMVMKDGQWVDMEEDMVMKDGTKVMKDGTVVLKNGTSKKLAEGQYVSMEGQIKKEKVKTHKRTENSMKKGE